MGIVDRIFSLVFGGGRTDLVDVVEVFRENAEGSAVRAADAHAAALMQFSSEFQHERRGVFDRFIDGINRLPRPAMALGTLALLGTAMVDPDWFSARMVGLAAVPEPLWWLLGAVVSFYFGARHQLKAQEFQRALAGQVAPLTSPATPATEPKTEEFHPPASDNAALDDWRRWKHHRG